VPLPKFSIVVAVDNHGGIGKNGGLPWKLAGDMSFFKRKTTTVSAADKLNAVIMGRKTWESIPEKFRPLKERLNIVISRQPDLKLPSGVLLRPSFEEAITAADQPQVESTYVIGGGSIYKEALTHPDLDCIYWTDVMENFDCDTFFPTIDENFAHLPNKDSDVLCENGIRYVFKVFQRK
jgi:dihydrofolate reductase